eukprot:gb/GECG01005802.1/.p1 GENE.gb/GECG01005802.1/~~gb/GECG01005802.1/.p1  ORF type:complete len:744 (+),score=80.52 gb/GECG01005802.1/:1-2232(+)
MSVEEGNHQYSRMPSDGESPDQERRQLFPAGAGAVGQRKQSSPTSPLSKQYKNATKYSSTDSRTSNSNGASTENGTGSGTHSSFQTPPRGDGGTGAGGGSLGITIKDEIDESQSSPAKDSERVPLASADANSAPSKGTSAYDDSGCMSKMKVVPGPYWVHNIVLNEACERFCYYGLRAILVLFMSEKLGFSDPDAFSVYEFFSGSVYVTGILGGWLADTYLGKFTTILGFSTLYCVGTICLVISAIFEEAWIMFLGLVCIAFGTGGIKPCVAAFGAEQYGEQSDKDITSFFLAFYFSINIGSVASYIVTPLLRHYVGYAAAFGASTVVLIVSIIVFVLPKKRYIKTPPSGSVITTAVKVLKEAVTLNKGCCSLLFRRCKPLQSQTERLAIGQDRPSSSLTESDELSVKEHPHTPPIKPHWLNEARRSFDVFTVESVKAVWNLGPILCVLPFFWMLFDQQGSAWTIQAKNMNRNVAGFEVQPDSLGVLNPFFVVLLIPLLGRFLFPLMEKLPCKPLRPTPLRKMALGMVGAAGSFVIAGFVQLSIYRSLQGKYGYVPEDSNKTSNVSLFWILPQYFLITFSEICVSTTGLEWMYTQAPHTMRGMIIALWYLSTGVGDYVAGVIFGAFKELKQYEFSFLFASLMLVSAVIFILLAFVYKPLETIQAAKKEFDRRMAAEHRAGLEGTDEMEVPPPSSEYSAMDQPSNDLGGDPNESPVTTRKLRSGTNSSGRRRESNSSFNEVSLE